MHSVRDKRVAALRRLYADHRLYASGRFGGGSVTPAPVIARRAAFVRCELTHFGELLRGAIAIIGLAARNQLLSHLAVARRALILRNHAAVPVKPKPSETIEDRIGGSLR